MNRIDPGGLTSFFFSEYIDPNNPNQIGNPLGKPFARPIAKQFVYKALGNSKLPCTDAPNCKCTNGKDGCDFYVFLTSWVYDDGSATVSLVFESHPGAQRQFIRPGSFRFDKNRCFGDFGRADMGNIVVEVNGTKCIFEQEMFDPETGQPKPGSIKDPKCKGIVTTAQINWWPVTPPEAEEKETIPIQQNNGLIFTFSRINKFTFNFDIETFCGGGGADPDGTGRPLHRDPKPNVMSINGSFP